MQLSWILLIIAAYFMVLMAISYFTSKGNDSETFFTGNRKSPWYIVAYGMIGAALSGVTFISMPGMVYNNGMQFSQFILGNIAGYMVITFVLIPLYYNEKLVSIYTYLKNRFGFYTYKSGALLFILSQSFGAALRMLLAVIVLHEIFSPYLDVQFGNSTLWPKWILALVFIVLILLYTFKSGIKTIVWTDMLQTTFLLGAAFLTMYLIFNQLDISLADAFQRGEKAGYTQIFNWDFKEGNYFGKQFITGFLIAIAMMGLDQNMMQKSLTIKNVRDAQKNTFIFSLSVAIAQIFFLFLGVMLFLYAGEVGAELPTEGGKVVTDRVFPALAVTQLQFGTVTAVLFILGIIAAAFSSADSALTALTTSFCYDFLGFDHHEISTKTKNKVHIGFAFFLFLIIFAFSFAGKDIISLIFKTAGYTYSPLLALFFLGIATKIKIWDISTPFACILGPLLTYFLLFYLDCYHGIEAGFLPILVGTVLTIFLLLLFKAFQGRSSEE